MNDITDDIKDMLAQDTTLGLVFATNLFIAREPDKPEDCVTIFSTPSFPPALTMGGDSYFYSSFQIRVRSTDYLEASELSHKIFTSLHARAQEVWNDVMYSIIQGEEPVLLDWDDKNRVRFIINFEAQRRF